MGLQVYHIYLHGFSAPFKCVCLPVDTDDDDCFTPWCLLAASASASFTCIEHITTSTLHWQPTNDVASQLHDGICFLRCRQWTHVKMVQYLALLLITAGLKKVIFWGLFEHDFNELGALSVSQQRQSMEENNKITLMLISVLIRILFAILVSAATTTNNNNNKDHNEKIELLPIMTSKHHKHAKKDNVFIHVYKRLLLFS